MPSDCGNDDALEDVEDEDAIDRGPDGNGVAKKRSVIYI